MGMLCVGSDGAHGVAGVGGAMPERRWPGPAMHGFLR